MYRRLIPTIAVPTIAVLSLVAFLGSCHSYQDSAPPSTVDSIADRVTRAEELLQKNEFVEAASLLESGLEATREDMPLIKEAVKLYGRWGTATNDATHYETARRYGEQAIDLGGADADIYGRLGWLKLVAQQYSEAIPLLQTALDLDPDHAFAMGRLGFAYKCTGKFEKAEPLLKHAIPLVEKAPDRWKDAYWYWFNLADCQALLGEYETALESIKKACALAPPEQKGPTEGDVRPSVGGGSMYQNLLGMRHLVEKDPCMWTIAMYDRLSDRAFAMERWDRTIEIAKQTLDLWDNPEMKAKVKAQPAAVYLHMAAERILNSLRYYNRPAERRKYAEKGIEFAKMNGIKFNLGTDYEMLRTISLDEEEALLARLEYPDEQRLHELRQEALRASEKAVEAYGGSVGSGIALEMKADDEERLKGPDDPHLKKPRAQDQGSQMPDVTQLQTAQGKVALPHSGKGDSSATGSANQVQWVVSKVHASFTPAYPQALQDVKEEERGAMDLETRIRHAEHYFEYCKKERITWKSDAARRVAGGRGCQNTCAELAYYNALAGKSVEAFNYSEQYKGRALYDLLGSSAVTVRRSALAHLRERQRIEHGRLDDLQQRLAQAPKEQPPEAVRGIKRDLELERTQYQRLAEDIGAADLEITNIDAQDVPKWEELRPTLDGITFISYMLMPDEANTILVATKDEVAAIPMKDPVTGKDFIGRGLHELVEGFRSELGAGSANTRDLSIEKSVGAEKAKTRPEGVYSKRLFDLLIKPVLPRIKTQLVCISPYEALNCVPFEALQDENGRFFIEDHTVAYAPSASVQKLCMDKGRRRYESVLALGNPNLRNPAFRLANAEDEVKSLQGLFPKVDIYTGDSATETIIAKQGRNYDILHFACHAEVNRDDPMLTSLRLSPDDMNDGYLHAGEVFELQLSPSLIVLSACNTGLGEITTGNELMGLTRSFLYAGAPAIIASLWTVDDRSTALLMQEFYKDLATMTKAEALRQAKLTVMKQYPNPFYWAAFCLQGDYR